MMQAFDVLVVLNLDKLLSKQSICRLFETTLMWHYFNYLEVRQSRGTYRPLVQDDDTDDYKVKVDTEAGVAVD